MLAYTTTRNAINIILDGASYTIPRFSGIGRQILVEIEEGDPIDEKAIQELLDAETALRRYSGGKLEFHSDGTIWYRAQKLPETLARQVQHCFDTGVPFKNLLSFFEKLQANPSNHSLEQLYKFLDNMGMPITPDGYFLGYKAVRSDYMDKYSGSFDNTPGGAELRMPRNAVCDDPSIGCSKGFHVGSYDYAHHTFKNYNDKVVVVKVSPADVVSVPHDYSYQKLRTCAYSVVSDSKGKLLDGGVANERRPYDTQYGSFNDVEPEEEDLNVHAGYQRVPQSAYELSETDKTVIEEEASAMCLDDEVDGAPAPDSDTLKSRWLTCWISDTPALESEAAQNYFVARYFQERYG